MKKVIYSVFSILLGMGALSAMCLDGEDSMNAWAIVSSLQCALLCYVLMDEFIWVDDDDEDMEKTR